MRRFIASRASDADVDDVLVETFLVVWRKWDQLPATHEERVTWVIAIADRCVRAHGRKAARHVRIAARVEQQGRVEVPLDPERDVVGRFGAESLLGLLPDDQADLLRRTVLDGEDLTEMAASLGISFTALTSRLHRARARLRARHDNLEGGEDGHADRP